MAQMSGRRSTNIRIAQKSSDAEKAITTLLHKLAFDEFGILDTAAFFEDDCTCESCSERRAFTSESIGEIKMIQSCWLELRQYIRIVYRLSMKGSLKSIDDDYQEFMKDIVSRLFNVCDHHQLFQRLEALVKEFLLEVKVILLQILDRKSKDPRLPQLFISGLLDRYNKVISAANVISPVLNQLEKEHLHQFTLTWKILNQRLFHSIIYSDVFFQNSLPLLLSQLSKMNGPEEHKQLVKRFLSFDNELGLVEGLWVDIETNIAQYLHFKKGRDRKKQKSSVFSNHTSHVRIEELQGINIEGIDPEMLDACECHVCLDASAHSPVELIEQVIPLNSHRSGFHLYPHIHGTRGELGSFISECEVPEICGQITTEQQLWQETFAKGINKCNKVDHASTISKHHQTSNKTPQILKDNGPDTSSHHIHCSKHSDIKRIHFTEQDEEIHTVDDSHSDNSQNDPRHCDCCYCEVFGHGLPSAAPMSRNYQEMRERLRILLNKKKSNCKTNSISSQRITHRKQQASDGGNHPPNSERDTRALEDLLDFIEGTEVKCRNEKKAAKKARQKEKKRILMNRKKREEEEKARVLEETLLQKKREEALASRETEDRSRNTNKQKKKGSKTINPNLTSSEKSKITSSKPGPQMVTIKRVMEPHNSEPTVTITLRGATPNQDRVLYTLLNGQVCKMKDSTKGEKYTHTIKSNVQIKSNINPIAYKVKDFINEKPKQKKEPVKQDNPAIQQPQNMKPVKELTNPTSIQINNAINNMSKKSCSTFNIADIKLPPGITITKVDPTTVQPRNSKVQENSMKKVNNQVRPSSEVIVVSTGKRKEPPIPKDPVPDSQNSKKKKNKKKNNCSVISSTGKGPYPGLEIQPIKIMDSDKEQDLVNHMSVLTISPYADNKVDKIETNKKKKKKQKKSTSNIINPEEWKLLDSVFAPKDIDLDDGEMDDAERELEAFKRFCLQSIPPERKEKVHLNIKDIVLKKKSTSFNY